MQMTDRVGTLTGRVREHRAVSKARELGRENEELRLQLRASNMMLDRERTDREELFDALKSKPRTVKARRGGLLRTIVVGGGAYLLGTHAGRERYEQIAAWVRRWKDREQDAAGELIDEAVTAHATSASTAPPTGSARPNDDDAGGIGSVDEKAMPAPRGSRK